MLLSYISGTVAVFLWALLPVLVKSSFQDIPITYFLVLRFILSLLLFVGFLPKILKKSFQVPLKLQIKIFIVLGANFLLQSLAIKELPVSWYILIFSLNPMLALIFMKIKISKQIFAGFLLSIAGVFLFVIHDSATLVRISAVNFIYLLAGMFTWVLYSVLARNLQTYFTDFEITHYTNFTSLLGCIIIWVFAGVPMVSLLSIKPIIWAALIMSSIGLPCAFYFYLFCLRRSPIFSQMSQYLELIFGLCFSVLLFGESMDGYKVLGTVLIIASLLIVSRSNRNSAIS